MTIHWRRQQPAILHIPVDAVHQVYTAMFYMHHSHNAPAFRVAAWLFQECGDTHRSRVETKGESGLLTPAGARARTRFEIALLLHANPKLRDHRKHALSEGKSRGKDDTNDPDEPKGSHQRVARRRRILTRRVPRDWSPNPNYILTPVPFFLLCALASRRIHAESSSVAFTRGTRWMS